MTNSDRYSSLRRLLLGGALAALVGCGSPIPFRPGYEPRPSTVTVESEEARALRLAVPMSIQRNSARFLQTRKELNRIRGEIPRNPFNAYENDMVETLGPEVAVQFMDRSRVEIAVGRVYPDGLPNANDRDRDFED